MSLTCHYLNYFSFFFSHIIRNQLSDANAYCRWSSRVWQREIVKFVVANLTIFIFPIFMNSLYESYLPLSILFIIKYFKYMVRNRLSSDTATFHVKVIFGVYLEYYWGVDSYKSERQALNTGLTFFCETKWRISGPHGNHLFHFILIFTTAVTNRLHRDSKDLNIIVVCTGLFIFIHWY